MLFVNIFSVEFCTVQNYKQSVYKSSKFSQEKCSFDLVDSPRLTGGGSKTEDHYFTDSALQNGEMCSRSPVTVQSSLPRGTCPAELEDKLMLYGANTQQLVSYKICTSHFIIYIFINIYFQ